MAIGSNEVYGSWDSASNVDSGQIFGLLKCGEISQLNVKFGWKLIGNRIDTSNFEGKIHFEEVREIVIPIEFEGNGSRTYQLEYIGPLERIAISPSKVTLQPGDDLIVTIDPQGLLTPGMYARGLIVFHDEGYEESIEVVLQSEFIEGGSSFFNYLGSPSQLIALSLVLGGIWFLLSIPISNNKIESNTEEEQIEQTLEEIYN